MMTKSTHGKPVQSRLWKIMLADLVDPSHELVLLAKAIDWERFETSLEGAYSPDNGRPSCPVRMLAGLTMLRCMYGLSDQEVLDGWLENPYWQYFCGGTFFEHRPPADQSTLSRWRGKLAERGGEEMLRETLSCALRHKVAKRSDFERVNADTHVQEKFVRHPTDARMLDRARERLVSVADRLRIRLTRNFRRKGKQMLRKCSGYAKARQYKRLRRGVETLKGYLRRIVGELAGVAFVPANARETALWARLQSDLALSQRLLAQDGHTPGRDRVYSLHEPQTECIAKGKAHKRYEFGVKAGLVTSAKTNWILGAQVFPGNPYDGHTLQQALEQAERICGVAPKQACVDLGYRKNGYEGPCDIQVVNRYRKTRDRGLLHWWKRRNAIEPVIGHVRQDHSREGRCRLAGQRGDALHTLLTAVGFNLRKLMKGLKRLFFALSYWGLRPLPPQDSLSLLAVA